MNNWKNTKIKYLAELLNGDRGENYPSGNDLLDEGVPFISSFELNETYVDIKKSSKISPFRYKKLRGLKLRENDIIYCLRGSVGKNSIFDGNNGTVSSSLMGIRAKKINYMFLYYLLNSQQGFYNKDFFMTGSVSNNLSSKDVGEFRFFVPDNQTQKKISNFLNIKLSEIDDLVSLKEKQIQLLEEQRQAIITEFVTQGLDKDVLMKKSGVRELGSIPNNWTIAKVKYYSKITSGGTPDKNKSEYWENGTIPWVSSGEVNKKIIKEIDKKITVSGLQNSSAKLLPKNTILMALNGQGKTKGTVAILKNEACVNQSLGGFIVNENQLNYQYLYYFFESQYKNIRGIVGDGLRDGLSLQTIGNIKIPIPSISEQEKIVRNLKKMESNIINIIKKNNNQTNKLKEYRQSLIHEAVTGKISIEEMERYLKEVEEDGD